MAFEVARARTLLDEGAPLVGLLRGRARIAVAGYVGGGRAALDAIDAAGYDVLAGAPKAGRLRRARATLAHLGAETMTAVALAYEHCRRVARESGSSFYAGMRLLPPDRRDALFAVYALARRIDDVADGDARAGGEARRARARCAAGSTRLGRAARSRARRRSPTPRARFPIPLERVRRARRRRRAGRARDGVRDVRRSRALLPVRRRLDRPPLARRLRLLGPRAGLARSPTTSASRSRSGTSCATSARTLRTGASTCPREDLERFGCEASGTGVRGADRARDRVRGASAGSGGSSAGSTLVPLLDRRSALLRARDGREVPPAARADRRRAVARPPAADSRSDRGRRGSCSRAASPGCGA